MPAIPAMAGSPRRLAPWLVVLVGLSLPACKSDAPSGHREAPSPAEAPGMVAAEAPGSAPEVSGQRSSDTQAGDSGPTDPVADVHSSASPPYDPGPPVVTGGAVDGASLRQRIRQRIARDTAPITVLRGGPPRELGQRICREVVPEVPADLPVLIKPNLGGFAWFKNPAKTGGDDGVRGRITDPEFVRGIIHCLKDRGHRRITVADGWANEHKHWKRLVRVSGYQEMADDEGVALVAMNDDGVFDQTGERPGQPLAITGMEKTSVPTLLMPRILAEHLDRGLYISAPKIKTHRFSVTTMAIKGGQGPVMYSDASPAHRQKWRTHRELSPYVKALKKGRPGARAGESDDRAAYIASLEVFAERMTDILEVEAPHVVLAEGAPYLFGDGFNELEPGVGEVADHVAIGGTNPILADRVGAELLGLWNNQELARELGGHATSPLITHAARRFGIDPQALQDIRVIGNGADLLASRRPTYFVAMAPFVLDSRPSAPGPSPGDAPAATLPGKPVAVARAVRDDELVIDGRPDEPAWQRAPAIAWQTDYAGEATGITTRARFLWSKNALYAAFTVEQTDLFTDRSRPVEVERDDLYREDCVEIFLAPDPGQPRRYFEIELGPHGHFFDLLVDLDGLEATPKRKKRDLAWSSGARIATTQDAGARRAVIEVALEARDIRAALRAGARLPLGLYRMEGEDPRHYLAWSPPKTPKPRFHVPEAFGVLVLEP